MKKNRLLILALVFVAAAIWAVWSRQPGTVKGEWKDFAVRDTARITRIFLSDRAGNRILLDRKEGNAWMVNDSLRAKAETIRQLLEVIYRVDVRNRVPRSRYNTIIKDLATRGIKCEIYLDGEKDPFKTYYIGSHTEDALGTYMMLENSTVPFVTEIPGFNGYLTPWYPTKINNWKDNVIFSYRLEEVASVQIDYPAFPQHSFTLQRSNTGFTLSGRTDSRPSLPVKDTVSLSNYLALLRFVPYEDVDKLIPDATKDSILNTTPAVIYAITDVKGVTQRVALHAMPLNDYSLTREDSTGTALKYDVDRMLGWLEKDRQWVTVQHFTFDPILRKYADFAGGSAKSTAKTR